jgi:hypothetical protein
MPEIKPKRVRTERDKEIQAITEKINNQETKPKERKELKEQRLLLVQLKYPCKDYSRFDKYEPKRDDCKACDRADECKQARLERLRQKEIDLSRFL